MSLLNLLLCTTDSLHIRTKDLGDEEALVLGHIKSSKNEGKVVSRSPSPRSAADFSTRRNMDETP